MFRCYFCKQVTPPGTKKQNIVIGTREKTYPSRRNEAKRGNGRFRSRESSGGDAGGKGVETTQEVPACPACAEKQIAAAQAAQVAAEKAAAAAPPPEPVAAAPAPTPEPAPAPTPEPAPAPTPEPEPAAATPAPEPAAPAPAESTETEG